MFKDVNQTFLPFSIAKLVVYQRKPWKSHFARTWSVKLENSEASELRKVDQNPGFFLFFSPWVFPLKTYWIFVETNKKNPEMMMKSFHRNWNMCFFQLKLHYSLKIHFWANSIKFKHLYSSILSYIIYHPRQ